MIRDATPDDAATLVDFNCRMCEETEHRSLHRETVERGVAAVLADRGKGRYFVYEDGGRVAGWTDPIKATKAKQVEPGRGLERVRTRFADLFFFIRFGKFCKAFMRKIVCYLDTSCCTLHLQGAVGPLECSQ